MRLPVLTLLLVMLSSIHAFAQDDLPPVEIGAGYGGLLSRDKGGDITVGSTRPAFNIQVTLPFTPRFAFEAVATISTRTSASALHVTEGLYILQVKQRLRGLSGERFHAFLTYGGCGYFASLHQDAVTAARPNGSTYETVGYSFSHTDPPFFAVVGGGFQREVGERAAFRADAQTVMLLWWPAGVRLSAGISILFRE
jgi:hypothetical protein